jgi:hypothetical protein
VFYISVNQKQDWPMEDSFFTRHIRNEDFQCRTSQISFLQSLVPIGPVVSEEIIALNTVHLTEK